MVLADDNFATIVAAVEAVGALGGPLPPPGELCVYCQAQPRTSNIPGCEHKMLCTACLGRLNRKLSKFGIVPVSGQPIAMARAWCATCSEIYKR